MAGRKFPEAQRREQILDATLEVAKREKLDGLTMRMVAAEAGLSTGLIFFHFKSKEVLLAALLDHLLDRLAAPRSFEDGLLERLPGERLRQFIQLEIEQLPQRRAWVELYFDFWVMATRHPETRTKIRDGLERYRSLIRPYAWAAIHADPDRYADISPGGLAAVAVSFIEGCAIQAITDPDHFDVGSYVQTIHALVTAPGSRPDPDGAAG